MKAIECRVRLPIMKIVSIAFHKTDFALAKGYIASL